MTAHHEVTMPKTINMADLVASLTEDATGHTKAPPERRRQTIWTPEGEVTPRQLARQARILAEAWYQALRAWETKTASDLVSPSVSSASGGRFVPVTLGASSSGNMVGAVTYTRLHTPLGWISAHAVTETLRRHDSALLDRVRSGQGLSTLLHGNGRGWAGEQARNYARVALSVAASLGDPQALTCLEAVVLTNVQDS